MEQNNKGGSSMHGNVVPEVSNNGKHDNSHLDGASSIDGQNENLETTSEDEDPLDHDKMVEYASPTSFSSSSNMLDVDYDEKDALDVSFSGSEEDDSGSTRADSESPPDISTTTPQWSMASASPLAGATTSIGTSLSPEVPPQTLGLNTVNASPKQSPTMQVMGRPGSNDPKRIPSSIFAPKPTNAAEWSVASNESLFSIHMGKSGELNRPDDWLNHPCFTNDVYKSSELTGFSSGLPTVMETASENDQKSASTVGEPGEKDLLEIQSEAPIVLAIEKEKLHVPDGKGVNPTERRCNPGSTPCLSVESGNTASSFAFPVMGGGSSMKSNSETSQQPPTPPVPQGNTAGETKSSDSVTTPKVGCNRCFNCFSCCAFCG